MYKPICNICSKTKFTKISPKVRDSNKHKIIQCKNCLHTQLYPIPTQEENRKFYDEDRMSKNIKFHSMKIMKEKSKKDTATHVNLTKKLALKKSKILEIGSGYGFYLDMMKKQGYDVTGIEISKIRRNYAKKLSGTKVLDCDLNERVPAIGKYDIIVLFHVLEYISNPIHFIKNISLLLKPQGKLLIKIPNVDDLSLKFHEAYRNWFWQRAHVNYFSPKVLRHVIKKAGFKKIKISGIQRYSIENMFSWRLTNKPQLKKPTFDLPPDYQFIDQVYKKHLEQNLICDTLLAIAQKN